MRPRALIVGLLWVVFWVACVTQSQQTPQNQDNYETVPIALGIAAAGVAISRAGGGCYATCAYDTRCDPDSGACLPTSQEDVPQGSSLTVPIAPQSPGPVDPSITGPTPTSTPMAVMQPSALGPRDETCGGTCSEGEYCNIRPDGQTECLIKGASFEAP